MIRLTRLNGSVFSLNPDLIHRAEETPDTVLTLIDGSRYVVVEGLDQLVDLVVGYRARVVAEAGLLAEAASAPSAHSGPVLTGVPAATDGDPDGWDDDEQPGPRDPRTGASVVRLRARRA